MVESFTIRSYTAIARKFRVEVSFACDLAAISTVKAGLRPTNQPATAVPDGLAWEVAGAVLGASVGVAPSEQRKRQ